MSEDTLATGPGPALASAREARNLSQRDVADFLNLSVSVVQAIELGDQDRLPPSVFTTGYIRAYAKLVELDPEPLLADVAKSPAVEPSTAKVSTTRSLPIQLPPSAVIGAGVVFVLLLVWIIWPSDEETPSEVEAAVAAQTEQAEVEAVELEAAREVAAAPDLAELINAVPDFEVPAESDATADEVTSTTTLMEGYLPLTGEGAQLLDLDFTEECWVEIKDADGTTLFADLGRPGRTFRFQGEGPFHLLLGYAPGVILSFNQEPVALSPHTRNNVASVVLGQ